MHESPQSHCGDNREGTLFSWLLIYIYIRLDIPAGNEISHMINLRKRLSLNSSYLKTSKLLINLLIERQSDEVFYVGLGEIHQNIKKGLLLICPILWATGRPTYKLAKIFLPFSTISIANEYTLHNLFQFVVDICQRDPKLKRSQSTRLFLIYKCSARS